MLLRRHLARGIEQTPAGPAAVELQVPTWTCNVVLRQPSAAGEDDDKALLQLAHRVKEVVLGADGLPPLHRREQIERGLRGLSAGGSTQPT